MNFRSLSLCVAAVLLALPPLTGCGYRLVGGEMNGDMGGGNRFAVGSVDDLSREPLLGPLLRTAIASSIVERGGAGDVTVEVLLHELSEKARGYVVGDIPREYLLSVKADYTLSRGGEVFWKEAGISEQQEFPAGVDINATRANKERGLRELARILADKILLRASLALSRGKE